MKKDRSSARVVFLPQKGHPNTMNAIKPKRMCWFCTVSRGKSAYMANEFEDDESLVLIAFFCSPTAFRGPPESFSAQKPPRTGLSSILAGFCPRSSALTPSAAPRRRRRRLLSFLVENGGSNALCLRLLPSHLFGISAAVIVSIQNARSQRSCPRSVVGSSAVSAPSTSSEEATALVSRRENSHHHILSHIIIISSVHTDSAYRLQIARSQRSIVGLGAVPAPLNLV